MRRTALTSLINLFQWSERRTVGLEPATAAHRLAGCSWITDYWDIVDVLLCVLWTRGACRYFPWDLIANSQGPNSRRTPHLDHCQDQQPVGPKEQARRLHDYVATPEHASSVIPGCFTAKWAVCHMRPFRCCMFQTCRNTSDLSTRSNCET